MKNCKMTPKLQAQIIRLIAQGQSIAEVARELHLKQRTIRYAVDRNKTGRPPKEAQCAEPGTPNVPAPKTPEAPPETATVAPVAEISREPAEAEEPFFRPDSPVGKIIRRFKERWRGI